MAQLPRGLHHTHIEWQSNVSSLCEIARKERNERNIRNLLIHFFLCAIRLEYGNEYKDFQSISEKIIRAATEVNLIDPRVSAAMAIKKVLSLESFPSNMLSRVSAVDVRNAIVCEMWKSHAVVVPSEIGAPPQTFPKHILRKMKTVKSSAQDNVLLLNLLKWINLAKRVVCVRGVLEKSRSLDDPELDICTGVWWKNITTRGINRVVWDLILDIAQYSSDSIRDESL